MLRLRQAHEKVVFRILGGSRILLAFQTISDETIIVKVIKSIGLIIVGVSGSSVLVVGRSSKSR